MKSGGHVGPIRIESIIGALLSSCAIAMDGGGTVLRLYININ